MRKLLWTGTVAFVMGSAAVAPAAAEYKAEHRGGTMRLVARSAAGTIDPHIKAKVLDEYRVGFNLDVATVGDSRPAIAARCCRARASSQAPCVTS